MTATNKSNFKLILIPKYLKWNKQLKRFIILSAWIKIKIYKFGTEVTAQRN